MDDFLEGRRKLCNELLKQGGCVLGKRFYGFQRIDYLAESIQRQKKVSEFLEEYRRFEEESRKVRLVARGLGGVVVVGLGRVVG